MFKKSGFTLIELLIVIVIIALLSIIGIVAYSEFLKSSRDSKRQADLKIIQSALEDYHADQLDYPVSVTPGNKLEAGGKTYLNQVPNDPRGTPVYLYKAYKWNLDRTDYVDCAADNDGEPSSTKQCVKYCLFAYIEGTVPLPDSGCTDIPQGYSYGVTRP